jgi:YVTN family beta-propeller protein
MVVVNPAGTYVYALSPMSDNVTVIDTSSDTVVATIGVGDFPTDMVINPQGTFAYVANQHTDTVSVINLAINALATTVTVGNGPNDIAFGPSGDYAYVTDANDVTLAIINTSTYGVAFVTTQGDPNGVAVNPAETFAYVTRAQGVSDVISLTTDTIVSTFSDDDPTSIAMNPSGTFAYVVNTGFDGADDYLTVLSLATNTVTDEVPIPAPGVYPDTITINSSGTYAYLTSAGVQALTIINLSNYSVTSATLDSSAGAVALNANGTLAYALDSDYVQVVNTTSEAVVATVAPASSGDVPWSIALNNSAVSFVATSGSAGCSVEGDALTAQSPGTCVVTATMAGDGTYNSISSSPTTVTFPAATSPGTPTGVTATPGNSSATIDWTAPTTDGGSQIIGYSVAETNVSTSTMSNNVCPSSDTSTLTGCTVNSLINGDSYTFSVAAINSIGIGAFSAASPQISPIVSSGSGGGGGGSGGSGSGGTNPPGGGGSTPPSGSGGTSGGSGSSGGTSSPGVKPTVGTVTGSLHIGGSSDLVLSGSGFRAGATVTSNAKGVKFKVRSVGAGRVILTVLTTSSVKSGTYHLTIMNKDGRGDSVLVVFIVNKQKGVAVVRLKP